jgi:hypothetical protein
MTPQQTQEVKEKIERCGFCGMYFIGNEYLYAEDLKKIDPKELDNAPLGYCPNAGNEDESRQEQIITRDMAIDAGGLTLEGQSY